MKRTYICIDCGKEFIIDSKRNTHAKRCPECRKLDRIRYNREWKQNKRTEDPNYAADMRIKWERKKFLEDPKAFYIRRMLSQAKSRAKKEGLPFNLDSSDIPIPEVCPILGTKLNLKMPNRGDCGDSIKNFDSPSVDKIIPQLGYVKGNVWVISYRANTIKNNCTFDEIEKLYKAMKLKLREPNNNEKDS